MKRNIEFDKDKNNKKEIETLIQSILSIKREK